MHLSPGDRRAFARLYDSEMSRVYRYILYRVGTVEEAEDLTSEVFHRALRHWPRMRLELRSPRAWLFTIATRLLIDHYRQRGGPQEASLENSPVLPSTWSGPEAELLQQEEVSILRTHLAALSERDRTVLTLRFTGDLSHREIGEILGISEGASAVALLRALRRLRQVYEGEER